MCIRDSEETIREKIFAEIIAAYKSKEEQHGPEVFRHLEKAVMLQILDTQWKEHLAEMDYLRKGIGLRGYAQKNPKQEYKREAFNMFTEMLERIKFEVVTLLSKVQLQQDTDLAEMENQKQIDQSELEFQHAGSAAQEAPADEQVQSSSSDTVRRAGPCLLYTSPSPRDLSTSRMPSSA